MTELRRQRALVHQHLEWLDGEIAAARVQSGSGAATPASGETVPAATSVAPLVPSGAPPMTATSPTSPDSDTEAVMAEYQVAPRDLQREVRNGCLLYFALALALLGLVVTGLYFALRH